ncbi:MAG: AraC family transcriptional regulator [Bacillota bacterium]|nr:AraC family transcriptional regulator [Bacillota bacterium]
MSYFDITQGIIDYIEDNLHENIQLEVIAKRTNFSLMQVYRIFSIIMGMTLKEYIRRRRMSKALFDIKFSCEPIINVALKSGYSTHEAFSRAFKELFGVLPIEYRKGRNTIIPTSKPEIMKNFIHKASHEAAYRGLYEKKHIEVFFAVKPSMKLIGRVNREGLKPDVFYDYCIKSGIDNSFARITDILFCCGACLNKPNPYDMHMFCVATPIDYAGEIPDGLEAFDIQPSEYAVFQHTGYPMPDHGGVINSAWDAVSSFKPVEFGYKLNMDNAPVIEIDDDLGYFLLIPVRKIK